MDGCAGWVSRLVQMPSGEITTGLESLVYRNDEPDNRDDSSRRRVQFHQMMSSPCSTTSRYLVEAALLATLVLSIVWAVDGGYLMQRQMWMDEIHSWLLIQDASTSRSLQALADGVDYNPPTYILLARQLRYLPGGITERRLRCLSLSLMLLAVLGVFSLLRRRYPMLICTAAVLLMASSVHLIHQSTEMRFYPLWLAACSWLCVAMDVERLEKQWQFRLSNVVALLMAVIITTTHYFGILTLGLICGGALLAPNLTKGRVRMILVIALTGGVCLIGCLPFLIVQRSALSQATWISPATVADSIEFLTALFPLLPVIVSGIAFVLSAALNKSHDLVRSSKTHDARQLAPCMLLSLMPPVIVLLSWTIQPAMVTRYAVTGVLGFGPIFAVLLSRCGQRSQVVLVMISGIIFMQTVVFCRDQWQEIDKARDAFVTQLKDLPAEVPIIFEDRTVSMPVLRSHPELQSRCSLIDFTDDQLTGNSRLRSVQRDVGRRIEKWYPEYKMRSLSSLRDESTFYVIPYEDSKSIELRWPTEYSKKQISKSIMRYDSIAK